MTRRRTVAVEPLPTVEYRGLAKGRQVKVRGERGQFTFQSARVNSLGEVEITVFGGPAHHERTRVFVAERIVVKRMREVRS